MDTPNAEHPEWVKQELKLRASDYYDALAEWGCRGRLRKLAMVYSLSDETQQKEIDEIVRKTREEGHTFSFKRSRSGDSADVILNGRVGLVPLSLKDLRGALAVLSGTSPKYNFTGYSRSGGVYPSPIHGHILCLPSVEESETPYEYVGKSVQNFKAALEAFLKECA